MPFVLTLAEMAGVGAEKANICALFEVGVVEIKPLLLALNEYALMESLAPVQYRLPFQYAGDPQIPGLAPMISCTICGSVLVQAGV